ncbi:23S rRNA (pseudouridine(1915)-N(3))-methyltransferase RlmH [Methylobacterium sp. 77]|uniref:23S rRNA (pseudouridine(1915)-N(3))-methyltransferase RlmH n=1 Tax=Methylobacterium sp. 77 TaxID=1101192 RepID=UPI00035F3EE1|nr:23S rRNA (pseudouridine(1915)-N(3))-methyltransferase RlmH [Methylobacterium sp. 77]
MRLLVTAVGRLKPGPERDLASRYRDRAVQLGRGFGLTACDIVEIPESRARRAIDRSVEEGAAILSQAPASSSVLLVYDERGRSNWTSERIAEQIASWRDAATATLVVAIGGADGLAPAVRDRADLSLAFGAATLPHGLVRVLVLEQVYRTLTILAGHPYHRGNIDAL